MSKLKYTSIRLIILLKKSKVYETLAMGRCQRAGTSKNKKVTENFPPALGSGVKILLKNHIFYHK